jgi:hypothetical protein
LSQIRAATRVRDAMNAIFKKLNYKDQDRIHVLNAPASFEPALRDMRLLTEVRTSLAGTKQTSFLLAFVIKQAEVDRIADQAAKLLSGDAVLWFAYPKGSSKKYRSEIARDRGWQSLGGHGFEPVRMVAIDEDWSALRFRRAEFIKTMKRSEDWAMSAVGKEKARAGKARKSTPRS